MRWSRRTLRSPSGRFLAVDPLSAKVRPIEPRDVDENGSATLVFATKRGGCRMAAEIASKDSEADRLNLWGCKGSLVSWLYS